MYARPKKMRLCTNACKLVSERCSHILLILFGELGSEIYVHNCNIFAQPALAITAWIDEVPLTITTIIKLRIPQEEQYFTTKDT